MVYIESMEQLLLKDLPKAIYIRLHTAINRADFAILVNVI